MKIIKFLLLISFLLIGCSSPKVTSFIGAINNDVFSLFDDVDYTFSFNKMESKELLKILDEDYYSHNKDINVSKLIKNSNKVFLSCGLYDLYKNVSLIDGNLTLKNDTTLVEVYEMNLVEIINTIFQYNDNLELYLFSLYNPYYDKESSFYNSITSLVETFNKTISDVCEQNNLTYIDVSFLAEYLIDFNMISHQGKQVVLEIFENYE